MAASGPVAVTLVLRSAGVGSMLGRSLAAADFNGSSQSDLVLGAPVQQRDGLGFALAAGQASAGELPAQVVDLVTLEVGGASPIIEAG
jgi:hypothetical protein